MHHRSPLQIHCSECIATLKEALDVVRPFFEGHHQVPWIQTSPQISDHHLISSHFDVRGDSEGATIRAVPFLNDDGSFSIEFWRYSGDSIATVTVFNVLKKLLAGEEVSSLTPMEELQCLLPNINEDDDIS